MNSTGDQKTQYRDVERYHLVCEHEGCRRPIAQPNARFFTRFTTCKRHCPESGFVVQRLIERS
jgi:hypothetical protein